MGCVYKIYKNDFVYYGSTKNFKRRIRDHKYDCYTKNNTKYNRKLYKIIRDNGGWESFTKEIIEDNIETEKEWIERENYYIRTFSCNMNTLHNMTKEERKARQKHTCKIWQHKNKETNKAKKKVYYQNNKEKLKASNKAYKVKNKEKIKAQHRKKIICECGRTIRRHNKKRHIKTQIHIKLMVEKLMNEYISQII